jgi:hypothetical protein
MQHRLRQHPGEPKAAEPGVQRIGGGEVDEAAGFQNDSL